MPRPHASNLLYFTIFAVIFMVIFSFTLTIMASIYIASDLGASTDIAIYSVSFYGVGNALGIPLGRSLAPKIGTVRLLVTCLYLFAFCSLLCGLAVNFPTFILTRFIQGVLAGPFYPLTSQLLGELTPPDKKGLFTSISLTMFSTVPIMGACWGGWLAYDFNWRLGFFINVPVILLLAWYIGNSLKGYQPKIKAHALDAVGYLSFFVAVFCLSFVAITGQEFDWLRSPMIITAIVIGLVTLAFFLLWSHHHPHPLLEFTLFKEPLFTYGIINLTLLFSAYFGIVVLLALWLSLDVNYTPIWVGLLLSVMLCAGIVPSILIGKHYGSIDSRIPLAASLLCLAISSFYTTIFNEYIDFERIAVSRILAGLGLVLFLPPIFRLCFHSFKEERSIEVLEMFQVVRALSSGVGVGLYLTLWQRRQVFYHERQGSGLTAFSTQTQEYFANAKMFGLEGLPATAELNLLLNRQSIALALNDCFYLMGWLMVALLIWMTTTFFWKTDTFSPELRK